MKHEYFANVWDAIMAIAYFVKGDSLIINNIFHEGRDWETIVAGEDTER